ncbi:MAG TPA: hypothetical protein VH206_19515 [Xanthobacteraceae bacterium]|jgi:hypothetical protein|nr:hypothetical protein [Xanthobacteraceae bacterium]
MSIEIIEYSGTKYAEIIRASVRVNNTKFFSPAESSFQFGLLAHEAGFFEQPHYHKSFVRQIDDLQQMFVMQRGVVAVELYTNEGDLLQEVTLRTGDAIVLIHGVHALRVIEDFQAISVKQGPYVGMENDKVNVTVKPKV